jgi:hypothetical protein
MGSRVHQLLTTLYVASSLALFAWGGADPIGGFCLRILSYCRPTAIMGTILDIVVVSCDVAGKSCEQLGWRVNMCLMSPFTAPVRARCFASSVVISRGYKVGSCPCANLHPLAQTPIASSPYSLQLKRKRGREIDLEIGGKVVDLTWCYFFFPSKLWWSRTGPSQRSRKCTYRTLWARAHDGGGAYNMSCAQGPRIPRAGGGYVCGIPPLTNDG